MFFAATYCDNNEKTLCLSAFRRLTDNIKTGRRKGKMIDFHKNNDVQAADIHVANSSSHDHLCEWIRNNIHPNKTAHPTETSYSLKHRFETATGCYVDNEAFKRAMLECGFVPVNASEQNHSYRISDRSPALRHRCI